MLVKHGTRQVKFTQIIDGAVPAGGLRKRLGASLKPGRRGHIGGVLHIHQLNHGATAEHRGQAVKQLPGGHQRPNTGGAQHLVGRQADRIHPGASQLSERKRQVSTGLAGV